MDVRTFKLRSSFRTSFLERWYSSRLVFFFGGIGPFFLERFLERTPLVLADAVLAARRRFDPDGPASANSMRGDEFQT